MGEQELVRLIVKTLEEKKAAEVRVLNVSELTSLGDYFIIADADNITHVKSLVDEVEQVTKQAGKSPNRIEKDRSANWIILDYRDVIVHIFYREARTFYDLERLWADGKEIDVETILEGKAFA